MVLLVAATAIDAGEDQPDVKRGRTRQPAEGAASRPGIEPSEPAGDSLRIGSVRFAGARTINPSRLERVAGLSPGDAWSRSLGETARERLQAWPFLMAVSGPSVERRQNGERQVVDLVFRVTESPVVAAVKFRGNRTIRDQKLGELALPIRAGSPFRQDLLRQSTAVVEQLYHQDGFLFAGVRGEITQRADGRLIVTIAIREGRRVLLRRVILAGASKLPQSETMAFLSNRPRRLFGLLEEGYYRPDSLKHDLGTIVQHYRSRGFLDVGVSFEELRIAPNLDSVDLVIRVDEGRRWKFEGVELRGNRLLPTSLLKKVARLPAGGYYSRDALEAAMSRLSVWYQDQVGLLPQIVPDPQRDFTSGSVKVVLQITERDHLFVDEVKISGNRRTRERVVRQWSRLKPGGPFTATDLAKSLEDVQDTGLFKTVEVNVYDGSKPRTKTVELRVEEHDTFGEIEAGGGASAGAGEVASFRFAHTNFDLFRLPRSLTDWRGAFTGGGQRLEFLAIPGNKESVYDFRFVEPYFFRSKLALMLGVSGNVFSRRSYDERHLITTARVRAFFDRERHTSLSLAYNVDFVKIDEFEPATPAAVLRDEGTTRLAYPRLTLGWEDIETNYFSGPRGFAASWNLDFADNATGSQRDFWRTDLRLDYALRLFDNRPDYAHTLHIGARFGWIEDRGSDVTHVSERFFLGGPRSFRGFRYRRLGPSQNGTPVGGAAIVHGSIDYSIPLVWREIRAVAVFDWGDIENSLSRLESHRVRTAVGGGLQFRFQAGGLRIPADLYWVQALSSERGDREQLFSFKLGVNF